MERPGGQWPFAAEHPEGVRLSLKVTPNARRTSVKGLWQGKLRLGVQAPPTEGKANLAVRKWAAQTFGTRIQRVEILRGDKSRDKEVLLRGLGLDEVREILAALVDP